jgi:S-DNA-T family DNA segregation ATPase FtsK/SpoIIIE
MAKKQTREGTQAAGRADGPPRGSSGRFWRYSLVLVLIGAAALAWMSVLSFSPTDPPSWAVYPPKRSVDNVAGIVGAYTAWALLYWLGGGAYMALLFVTVAAFLLAFGGRITLVHWRVIGVALLVVSTSAAVYMLNPDEAGDPLSGSAGILGISAGRFLLSRFATVGGWIILVVSFCIGLMLAADSLVLQLPRLGRKAWQRRGQIASLGTAFRGRAQPQAAVALRGAAGVRAGISVRPAPRAIPSPPALPGGGNAQPRPAPSEAEPKAPGLVRRLLPKPKPALPRPKPAPPRPGIRRTDTHSGYSLPSTDLLAAPSGGYLESQEGVALQRRAVLRQTLDDFNVAAQVVGHQTGPVITLFELSLAPGVKVSQISNLCTDIARALAVPGVRVVSPLPGRDTVGIEVPNLDKEIVRIRELMGLAPDADGRMYLPLYLGKDAAGDPIVSDLAKMPHMLMAGTTGSGKSVCINGIVTAMLMTRRPEDVRLILIDPKMVEMAAFEDIPHLLCPIVNDMRKAEEILEWAAMKMDERYELFKEAGVKNIAGFNRLEPEEIYRRFHADGEEERTRIPTHIPYYVIIVDELADLIMTSSKEVENYIIRIAQKARAVGIHLILATQRPSVNVVTGLIKSNMPCRISFRVASRQESRIVLDQNGAEVLLGQGDMLFLKPGTSSLVRAQGTYVDDTEIRAIVGELRKNGRPEYNAELMRLQSRPSGEVGGERDELFDQAVEIVLETQRGSVSLLQRRLAVGYSRASRIIDQMAESGILGDYKGSQARECLMTLEDWQQLRESIAADQSGDGALDGEPTSA